MPLRFSIRDLLWLTVVVALAVGWWVDRSNITRHAAESYAELEQSASVTKSHTYEAAYTTLKLKLAQLQDKISLEKAQKASETNGSSGK